MNNSTVHHFNNSTLQNNLTAKSSEDADMATLVIADEDLLSDDTEEMVQYVVDIWVCSIMSYFGIGTNIINIIVFNRMGFKDTMNISLTFIAALDLLRCVCFAVIRLYGLIELFSPAQSTSWKHLTQIYVGYLYTIAGYVSGVLAGYVAVERCLCISMPLTVKSLLTKKVVFWTSITLLFIVTASYVCVYALFSFHWTFSTEYNASVLIYRYSSFAEKNPSLNAYINAVSMFWPILAFIVICICTAIISYHLRKASGFRLRSSIKNQGGKTPGQLSRRDKQVMKMLLVIIVVYIVCFLPRIVFYIPHQIVSGFQAGGKYENTFWVYVYIMGIFDLFNSSTNLIVYYFMSTQFKKVFMGTFFCKTRRLNENHSGQSTSITARASS